MQSEITCGICRNYFSQLVTMECGHSFCKVCVPRSPGVEVTPFSCPGCSQVSQTREFPALSVSLEKLTDIGKQLSPQRLQSTEEQMQCPTHKEVLKFFCEEDQTLLCVSCCQMHEAHNLSPVEEAAHDFREKLQEVWSRLWKDFEEAKKLLSQEKEVERPFVDWEWILKEEYCRLHTFLREEGFQCLERVKEEQRNSVEGLFQHIQVLQETMDKLEESRHKSNDELLKDIRELLARIGSVLNQRPKTLTPTLRKYPISGMIDILNKFRVDIRVHPESDTSYVSVSEDLKSIRVGDDWKLEAHHFERSTYHYVFAEQAFRSGRQYWEVDVTQVPQWVLGIYTTPYLRTTMRNPRMGENSRMRRNSCSSVFLLRCVKKEEHYHFQTYPGSLNHQVEGPVPRIGVYVAHSPGTILFYNVLQRSLIYKFQPIPFTNPVRPVFSPGPPLPGTRAGPMIICPFDSHLCSCCYSSS
ncbi:tripartite motif-containing protein 64-like [Dromiciops gliroides]|uniref:tripartite motif-containing protein 64-like n=1 Tax=Dromiciops gliroides TaxID=33562 RepID=UPI001CC6C039|nr:tripartite motif-containing protein 64-like [Dromiciops gliroides]